MPKKEQHERRHEYEMPPAGGVVVAEYCSHPFKLDGPVNDNAGKDCTESGKWNRRIGSLLKRIIFPDWRMLLPETKIIFHHRQESAGIGFPEDSCPAPVFAQYIIENPGCAVDGKPPHREEMPLSRPGEPTANCKYRRNFETEKGRSIINPQAAEDHDPESGEIHPVREPDDERVLIFPLSMHSITAAYPDGSLRKA